MLVGIFLSYIDRKYNWRILEPEIQKAQLNKVTILDCNLISENAPFLSNSIEEEKQFLINSELGSLAQYNSV